MKSKGLVEEMVDRPFLTKDLWITRLVVATVIGEVVGQFLVQINPRHPSIRQPSSTRRSPSGLYQNRPPILVPRRPGGLQFPLPCVRQFAARSAAIATPLVQYCPAEPEVLTATQSPIISLLVRSAPNIAHGFFLCGHKHRHGLQKMEERLMHVGNQSYVLCLQPVNTIKSVKPPYHAHINVLPFERQLFEQIVERFEVRTLLT